MVDLITSRIDSALDMSERERAVVAALICSMFIGCSYGRSIREGDNLFWDKE